MSKNECSSTCSFVVVLFSIFVILMCLKYYTFYKSRKEHFLNSSSDHGISPRQLYNPCSSENFKKNLHNFYKSANQYRESEKKLNQSLIEYEDNYKKFKKDQQTLNKKKENIMNCLNTL